MSYKTKVSSSFISIKYRCTYTHLAWVWDGVGALPSPGPAGKGKEITGAIAAAAIKNLKIFVGTMLKKT